MEELEKIKRQEEEDKVHKEDAAPETDTRTVLIGIALLIVLFGGLFAIGYFSQKKDDKIYTLDEMFEKTLAGEVTDDNYIYNGFAFVRVGNLWYTRFKVEDMLFDIPLHFDPKSTDNITLHGELNHTKFNTAEKFYITFDPEQDRLDYVALTSAELSLNMARGAIGKTPEAACAVNKTFACSTRPIINCSNTEYSVIYLRDAKPTGLFMEDNCVIVQGERQEVLRAADRLIYQWYGMMK